MMPDPATILEGLTSIANRALIVAVAWHLVLLAAGMALGLGWRPSRRRAGALLAAPVASASAAAFSYGNPFNGIALAVLALTMLGLAGRLRPGPVERSGLVLTIAGIATIAFASSYPHFLSTRSPAIYLVAAPAAV